MHLRNRCVLLASLFLMACTSAASAQTTLRYQFKAGDKLPYVMEQKMKISMNILGMDVETKLDMLMDISLNVVEVNKDGSVQMQFKVTSAQMNMDGPTGKIEVTSKDKLEPEDPVAKILSQIVKALGAMEMTGQMLPTGETKNVKVSEATAKALEAIPGADKAGDVANADSLKSMLSSIVFPTEAVEKGKTWTNKTESKSKFGKAVTENTFTYEGTTEKDNMTLQKISLKPNIKIEADPNADIKIKVKEVKGKGQILFNNKTGRLIESTTTQTSQMQINAGGIDIDQRVEQTTTLRQKK
jgi:hypothetical protein